LIETGTLHPRNIMQKDQHVPVKAVHRDKVSHVIITCNMYRRRAAMPPVGQKKRRPKPPLDRKNPEEAIYMPEPWIFFQLASIACTALSGSGT